MRTKSSLPILFLAVAALSGCVASDIERAGVGAVAGGVGTALLGASLAPIVAGVAVGAAAGAFCDDVNAC